MERWRDGEMLKVSIRKYSSHRKEKIIMFYQSKWKERCVSKCLNKEEGEEDVVVIVDELVCTYISMLLFNCNNK